MAGIKKLTIYILILLPVILALKNFFDISNPLVWGDAPFFYPENLKELFNIPYVWDVRNSNFGSPQLLTLWLYLPTFLLGFLHNIFGFQHEIVIRLIFYFSFLVCGSLGMNSLLKRLNFSELARAFGVLFYILNTYSLVLIDGGQIGVLLSYGLFPLALVTFLRFMEKNSMKNFFLAVTGHLLIFNIDLRIALVLMLFETIWLVLLIEKDKTKGFVKILKIYLTILGLCSFWIIPFLEGIGKTDAGISQDTSNFIGLFNAFYLFQPHFPNNEFGELAKTPIYFIFLPVIFFTGLLKRNKFAVKISLLFLLFVFLAKGSGFFLGEIYSFVVNNMPLGNAFRDSSKFYIPAILTASILLSNSTDFIKENFNRSRLIWMSLIYLAILLTIYPAFAGNLSGVLGRSPDKTDFYKISELIQSEGYAFRTLWFRERPSLGYADWSHPALSANSLFQDRPFASMIDGDYDLFGFLHDGHISDWYELLGIKYIFYPPYERQKTPTKKELAERKIFENFISKIPGLGKINSSLSFPGYETGDPQPRIYIQEKILFLVGGEEIYKKLFAFKNFALEKSGMVFLESCKLNPEVIFKIKPQTFGLVLTDDKNDLLMPFFCDKLFSPNTAIRKEWAINSSTGYLNWKAQLLERGVRNYDYDFGKGMAYSTKENEKLEFKIKIPETKNYYLPVRFLTATGSAGLQVNYGDNREILRSFSAHKLQWSVLGPVFLKKGETKVTLTNKGGLVVLNTLGIIAQDLYEGQQNLVEQKLKNLIVFNPQETGKLGEWFNSERIKVDYELISPVEYKIKLPGKAAWLVFSERFDQDWNLKGDAGLKQPLPFYSIINGFYIGDIPAGNYDLLYLPQRTVSPGILLSVVVFLGVCFGAILHIISKGKIYEIIKKYIRNIKS